MTALYASLHRGMVFHKWYINVCIMIIFKQLVQRCYGAEKMCYFQQLSDLMLHLDTLYQKLMEIHTCLSNVDMSTHLDTLDTLKIT